MKIHRHADSELPQDEFARIATCLREAADCQPLMIEWGRSKFGDIQSERGRSLVVDIQRRELLQLAEAADRLSRREQTAVQDD